MADPTLVAGKWTKGKDPDEVRLYQFGFAKELAASGTTILSAVAIVGGVVVAPIPPSSQAVPLVSGTDVLVMLSGLDITANASNFCTIRVTCANGEQIDGTLWFTREDH